ncbi:hypothetical protein pb186bvf_002800 [Paramecium bursaria]
MNQQNNEKQPLNELIDQQNKIIIDQQNQIKDKDDQIQILQKRNSELTKLLLESQTHIIQISNSYCGEMNNQLDKLTPKKQLISFMPSKGNKFISFM